MNSSNIEWISIQEACELLQVSRPTLNKYRADQKLREFNRGKRIYLSKLDLIEKILIPLTMISPTSFLIFDRCEVSDLISSNNIFDLRRISHIDGYGAMSLLCVIKDRFKEIGDKVYLIVNDSLPCQYLKVVGFFNELKRGGKTVYVDEDLISDVTLPPETILPLQTLGYRGAEKKVLDHLYERLLNQGFSEDICGYLGWTIGELADNAHTHAGGPCFVTINSLEPKNPDDPKFLQFTIGDIGGGIQNSIRKNSKYSDLADRDALLISFKAKVTSWDDEANRGKGLNDLISIAIGNRAWLRVDSNGDSVYFDFRSNEVINTTTSMISVRGSIISLVLIDSKFEQISRKVVDSLIDIAMERLQ